LLPFPFDKVKGLMGLNVPRDVMIKA
jgi:hypothetical protein